MLRGKSKTKISGRKSSMHQSPSTQFEPLMLDKKDEIWCYVLIKLFTAILEDPEEAERLLKPTRSAFDIDLQPAVQQLKAAIERKKSENSQIFNAMKNVPSVSSTSSKTTDQAATKSNRSYNDGDSSSISSSSCSSSDPSDDETYTLPQTASHSIWTQRNVGDSLKRLASSAAFNDTSPPSNIRMEDVFRLVSSFAGKS